MYTIFLENKLGAFKDYEAFKFPGGELHVKLMDKTLAEIGITNRITIRCRLLSSDDLILLIFMVNIIHERWPHVDIDVRIGYMAYAQADDQFTPQESFSLKYIGDILNTLPVANYYIYDPHSLSTKMAIKHCRAIDNRDFISNVLMQIYMANQKDNQSFSDFCKYDLCVLSPDAGAYKKIFKLLDKLNIDCSIETANKYRDQINGGLQTRLSTPDFHGKVVLVIDDICAGGGTFLSLGEDVLKKNVKKQYLAISHGVFGNKQGTPQKEIIEQLLKIYSSLFVTNSRAEKFDGDISVYKIL